MTGQILDYKEINPESIIFEEPKKVKGGSYMTEIKYRTPTGEDVPFIIQTPRLISSEGIVRNDTRAHCELEFDKNHWPFYEFITNIDDHNIVIIEKYSEKWFTSKFPIDVVEEFYKTPVKLGRGKNPPKLKVKIPINRGELSCNIFDNVKNAINYTEVKKNNKVVCVLHLQGLRFLKQQVICEWVPLQIKVCKESVKQKTEYMINDTLLSDYEDNVDSEQPVQESTPQQTQESVEEQVVEQTPESVEEQVVEQTTEPVEHQIVEQTQESVEQIPESVEQTPESVEQIPELVVEPVQEQEVSLDNFQEQEPDEVNGLLLREDNNISIDSLIPDIELDTDDLESIDLSQIQDSNEESLETKLENLNSELTEKNRLIEQMKTLLNK